MKNFFKTCIAASVLAIPLLSHADYSEGLIIDNVTTDGNNNTAVHFASMQGTACSQCFNAGNILFIPYNFPNAVEMRKIAITAMLNGLPVGINRGRGDKGPNPFNTAYSDYIWFITIFNQ